MKLSNNLDLQVDASSLVAEICGAKRPGAVVVVVEGGKVKRRKGGEEEKLIMTGLSDKEIEERMGEGVQDPKDEDLGQVDEVRVSPSPAPAPAPAPAPGGCCGIPTEEG